MHDLQLDQVSEKDFTSLFEPIHVFKFDYTGKSAIVKTGHSSQIISALSSGMFFIHIDFIILCNARIVNI